MKNNHHVCASAKPGVSAAEFENRIIEFLDSQIAGNHLCAYRILRFDSNTDSGDMPEYQIICNYASEDDLKNGFEGMRPDGWKQEPHAGMMEMAGTFRVAFSEDVA